MGRGLGDVLHALFLLMPPWAVALLGVAAIAFLLPRLRYRVRSRQVRESIRRLVRSSESTRPGLVARAFDRAGDDVELLEELVREARKRDQPDVLAQGLERLRSTPQGARRARAVEAEVRRPGADALHPLEAVVRIEALLESEAYEAARARLTEALAQHPADPELLALQRRMEGAEDSAVPMLDEATGER